MEWSKTLKENCQEIQEKINITQFLTKAKRTGYVCPWCGSGSGKHGTGVKVYKTNTIHCYNCHKSADVLAVYRQVYNKSVQEAVTDLLEDSNYEKPKEQPAKVEQPAPQVDYTPYYRQVRQYITDTDYHRGITLETLRKFWIGFDAGWENPAVSRTYPSKRLIIPIDSYHYLARAVGNVTKWKKLYVGKGRVLFNRKALENTIDKPIFVVEGEIDAVSIVDCGGVAVGLGGKGVKPLQEAIQEHVPKVPLLIALDNDKAGQDQEQIQAFIDLLESKQLSYGVVDTSVLFGGEKDANDALIADRKRFEKEILKWEKMVM